MKLRSQLLLAACLLSPVTCLLAPPLLAAPAEKPAQAFRVNAIERYNTNIVEPGMPNFQVRRALGEPHRKLDADTWIYERFSATDWKIDTGDCTTLVITFTQGLVSELRLVNDRAAKIIAANLEKAAAAKMVAAK